MVFAADRSHFAALRIEWAKSRARSMRWNEEELLLKEEMRRVGVTLEWKANWWESRQDGWSTLDGPVKEGVRAYALEQAGVYRSIAKAFRAMWEKPTVPLGSREDSGEGPETFVDPRLEAILEDAGDDDI